MKNILIKKLSICSILLLITCISIAQLSINRIDSNLFVTVGLENRKTDFRWSIAGNSQGKDPNIFSEIIFNPIHSAGIQMGALYKIYDQFAVDVMYEQQFTYNGSATDFDYAGDNRTLPTTELYLKSNKGKQSALNASVLYNLVAGTTLVANTGIGYSYAKRLFYLLNDSDPSLQTTYSTSWLGPTISSSIKWQSPWFINLGADICFSILKYNAKGNWNLIEEFKHPVSFAHTANGSGWNSDFYAEHQFRHIALSFHWLNSNWRTSAGTDKLYLKNGTIPETRLNGAFEKSNTWRLSATYSF